LIKPNSKAFLKLFLFDLVVRWFTFNNIFLCTWSKFDYNGLTFFNN
jgi:hypothetical protein